MIEGARTHGFPGLDAASSDLASAELEDAMHRLMEMVSGQISVPQSRRTTRFTLSGWFGMAAVTGVNLD
jgi:hypothetical protein